MGSSRARKHDFHTGTRVLLLLQLSKHFALDINKVFLRPDTDSPSTADELHLTIFNSKFTLSFNSVL